MSEQQTPERVTSEPVPVPPSTDDGDRHRDAAEDVTDRVPEDGLDDDALDDRGTFDDPVLADERNDPDDLTAVTPGEPEYHEPAPQTTAFGAATVGGAAAAAAQAGPSREVRDRTDAEPEENDRLLDPATEGADRDLDATASLDADRAAEERAYEDTADRDHDGEYTHDDTRSVGALDGTAGLPETAPAVDTPADPPHTEAVGEPVAGLWDEATVQSYRDRWREVQFRFVDDPPAAAREANQLVEEAVGALTAELTRQKGQLSGESSEDTEDLRAVVRRHRDFLDRLLGL